MNKLRSYNFNPKFRLLETHVPMVLLLILILAFGIFIPQLGIYQDDWVFVYNAYARGSQGLREFLNADGAPFSSFLNVNLFRILGFKPLYWHLFNLIARWLTVVGFWLLLRKLWRQNSQQIFWACLIFAVHPFFTLQPLAFTYLHIWFSYGFLVYSMYWMVLSIDQPKKFWLYSSLSVCSGALAILTSEYFAGLELLRPVILWLFLRELPVQQKISKLVKTWIPYIVILGLYIFWRFFLYEVPVAGRNDPILFTTFLNNPLSGLHMIVSNLLPDLVTIVVSAWYRLLDPARLNLTFRRDLGIFLVSTFVSLGAFVILKSQNLAVPENKEKNTNWQREAFWLGLFILLLGLVPPYAGGMFINEKNPLWNSRFGLASLPGASLLLVVFLDMLSTDVKVRMALLSILIGFSVGYHIRYTNDFKNAWKKEQNFFRQLSTRVPMLQKDTVVVAEGEILTYMGTYPTAFAINTIYSEPNQHSGAYVDYWFLGITSDFANRSDEFIAGMPIQTGHGNVGFIGNSSESLIISFEPEQKQCLYIIRPEDTALRYLPPIIKDAKNLSALDRIDINSGFSSAFLASIGIADWEDWCSYYQRADLARQKEDWQMVTSLWQQARKKGFTPDSTFEYFLFLEAYVQLGQWDDAIDLSLDLQRIYPGSRLSLCDYWNSLPASPERDLIFNELNPKLNCFEN